MASTETIDLSSLAEDKDLSDRDLRVLDILSALLRPDGDSCKISPATAAHKANLLFQEFVSTPAKDEEDQTDPDTEQEKDGKRDETDLVKGEDLSKAKPSNASDSAKKAYMKRHKTGEKAETFLWFFWSMLEMVADLVPYNHPEGQSNLVLMVEELSRISLGTYCICYVNKCHFPC